MVVTRAESQAQPLIDAVEATGGTPVVLPLLELVDAEDGGAALNAAIGAGGADDWLVVLSPNGARRLPEGPFPGNVAAIAAGTAQVLTAMGYAVDLIPKTASSVGLLEAFADRDVAGRVIIAQAEVGRPELAHGLRERGVVVDVIAAYRNVMPELDPGAVAQAADAEVVVFASPSAVTRYVEHVASTPKRAPGVSPAPKRAVCIGTVTAAEAESAGFEIAVADSPTIEAIMTTLKGFVRKK